MIEILQCQHELNAMKHHYDVDSCLTDSIVLLLRSLLKISRLSYPLYFSHIYSRNINIYDGIKIETSLCFSLVVRRVSTNFSDNPCRSNIKKKFGLCDCAFCFSKK